MRLFRNPIWKKVGAVALLALVVGGSVAGVNKIKDLQEEETKVVNPLFIKGGIDNSTGKFVESDDTYVTKNLVQFNGSIKLNKAFDFNYDSYTVNIFVYDDNGIFIVDEHVNLLKDDFSYENYYEGNFCRLVVSFNEDYHDVLDNDKIDILDLNILAEVLNKQNEI